MILPSEDLTGTGRLGQGHSKRQRLSMGNVTHPFVTRMYRCVAPYETKDTMNRAFPVALGERLDVQIKDPAGNGFKTLLSCRGIFLRSSIHGPRVTCFLGTIVLKSFSFSLSVSLDFSSSFSLGLGWWLVENEDKKLAWFPAPYLELCDEEEEEDEEDGIPLGGKVDDLFQLHIDSVI